MVLVYLVVDYGCFVFALLLMLFVLFTCFVCCCCFSCGAFKIVYGNSVDGCFILFNYLLLFWWFCLCYLVVYFVF